jgi:site-specific DNA-methyltransferase (adenine-specific)
VYNDARADRRGRVPDNTWILRPQDARHAFHSDHDTWYFARIAGTFKERAGFHGCQMPEQLLARIIRGCSNPDDVVLDPFAGSGSTLLVAKKLGRRWIGYELSAEYARHAKARIAEVRPGDPIEGPEDALSSAPSTPLARGRRRERIDERGIVEAFGRAADGYASDRVIADPVLNAAFVDQCGALGLSGRPRDWNLTLLALRKAGKLGAVSATKKTTFSWQQMEPFLFASEMALRRMLDMGHPSLDHVLCDPFAVARFDELARSLAPGFTSLEYRWAALRLRKDARLWRRWSKEFSKKLLPKKPRRIPLDKAAIAELDDAPGVYLLSMVTRKSPDPPPVYVGETSNLADRGARTACARSALDQFLPNPGKWQLDFFLLPDLPQDARRGLQSQLIARHQPALNYLDLGRKAPRPARAGGESPSRSRQPVSG